jgi:CubicO group peptidase (beta-lactamase class C family)
MQRHAVMLLPLLFLSASPAAAQSPTNPDLASQINAYAAPLAEAGHLSGMLLVARGAEVLYERSWGLADRERGRAFDPETPSCIASVTKPTTIILASQLIESGAISLRDPISKWLKDFPNGDQIEFRHLLFHLSGIPHRLTANNEENVPRTAADMVELTRGRELDFKPGSRRKYSSGGFSVMVRVLELASGKRYELLLREGILEPLDLSHTFHPGPGVDLAKAAKSYTWSIDGQEPAGDKHYSFLIGAGALFTTPRDLLAIARTLIDGGFGKQSQRRLLRGGRLQWNGITNSYRAFLDYNAKTDLTLILVSNQMVGANDLLRRNVPKIVAGETVDAPSVPQPHLVSLPEELLARYAGQYKIGGSPIPVRAREGALFANDWILLPISEKSFFSPQDYATVSVVGDDVRLDALDWAGMQCPRLGPLAD